MVGLNFPVTGQLGSIGGIDYQCFRQARQAKLIGTFRALLSNKLQHASTIVTTKDRGLPVGNLKVRN